MIKFSSCFRVCGIIIFITAFSFQAFSQVVYNNGLEIYAKEGAIFFVDGTVQNEAGIIEVEENAGNNAQMIIQQDFINNSTAGGNGYYRVLGNWVNNNTFNAGTGTVFLEGGNQFLDGTVSTYFNNLTLDGSGLKTQTIDQYCTGILDLKYLELQNEIYGFYVTNTDVAAIIRTTGFVSALDGGFLSRQTNSASMYLYPVGSSVGVTRYRPVELTPSDASANTYTVRMANVLATTEGYDVNALPPKICEVNPEFYHQINQTAGTTSVDLDVFYNETEDGEWDGLAKWTTSPDLWERIMTTVITPGSPFNEAFVASWNDFVEIPYILYRYLPDPTITDPGAMCEYDVSQNLVAADPGGTWTGTGITDAANGTFDPSTAGPGLHTITYEVGSGTCISTDQIDITVNATPDATITDPGDFCDTDAPLNLTAATAGGTWSGTGITDAVNGTFDPSVASVGSNSITYDITVAGCTSSDMISIDVFTTPDATITAPGTFCDNDASINLTAATAGGTWSGTGITDAVNGTFDPSTAGAGLHTITYDVGTGSCTDTDQIDITVNATPDATITDPGDFCNTDSPLNLTAATAGGTWSGTGITDAVNGTFDPSSASVGSNSITYDITVAGCTSSDMISIDVFTTPDATITAPGAFCDNDASINLTAATTGGTWSGTGITDAVNGTFDPSTAGAGLHTITYDVGTGSCTDTDQIDITVNATPDATITDPGDFCDTDAPLNLTAATAGGTWSGTGITDAVNGTFDPSVASVGSNSITYDITVAGCTSSDMISIDVFTTPDATITAPGTFCDNDASINLTAATAGGTWSGTGITDAVNGTFDPSTAGAGLHTITYDVGTGSCTDTDQIDITVNAAPDATITDPGDFCNTDSPLNLTSATAGGTWSGTGITDAVNGTFDPSVASIGSNSITYDITVAGCTSSDNISIDIYDTPDATIVDPGTFCTSDASLDLTAATAGGTWSGTGITDASNGTFDPASAGSGVHTITYNVGTGSCAASDQIDLTVNLTPDASITNPGDFCNTDVSTTLLSATMGGTWTGTGIINATTGEFDPSSANIGVNNISYEVTISGCTGTDNIVINVYDTPDATITDPGVFCSSDVSMDLTAVSTGGTWSGTGITDAVNGTFDPAVAGVGIHTITYDVGTGSCTDTDQIDITVNATPDATITDPGDFCTSDATLNLSAATAGGTWSGTGITDAVNGTFDPSVANIGSNNISYDITVAGCSSSDIITIDVYDTPDATITDPGAFCSTDIAINLNAASTGGTWSGTGITDAANGTFDPAIAGEGTHTITYNVGTGSCAATDQIDLIVNLTPDASITNPGDFCNTDISINLTAATTGGTWTGTGIVDAANGTFDPAVANIGTNSITYEVTSNGCTSSDNITISVFETPDATITDPGSFCSSDEAVNLTAVSSGGTWSGTGITDSNNGVFDPSIAGVGTHTITYNAGTGLCTDSDQIDILVNEAPNVVITNPGSFCYSDSPVNLTGLPAGGIWSGTGITDPDLGTFDPATAGEGDFNINYVVSQDGCTGSDQVSINVYTSPDVSIDPAGPFCFEANFVQLTAETEGGVWSGPGVDSDGIFNVVAAGIGQHEITYQFSGNCGAAGTTEIVVVPGIVQANYTVHNPICQGGLDGYIEFTVSGGTYPYTYSWGIDGYSETNIISGLTGGIYSVTITDSNGCSMDVDGIILEEGDEDCVFIPNAFTPNGDGINDQWIISNIDSYNNYYIQVFNRWGQEIYNGVPGSDPWDGTWNGNVVPTGGYIYIVQIDEIAEEFVGVVMLVK